MENSNKESIKLKIRALLSKNVDNGATEAEAASAMKMASKLMEKYFISYSDIKDPFLGEKAAERTIPMVKSSYDFSLCLASLSKLFDCFCYSTPRQGTITFFGFENDTEFCAYFYVLIANSAKRDARIFRKQGAGVQLKEKGINGKTLVSNFIKGYLLRVSQRMKEMFENRKVESTEEYGIILYDKAKLIKKAYDELDLNLRKKKANVNVTERSAFLSGAAAGSKLNINSGLNGGNSGLTKSLN